jgi:hypothetical protein
MEAAMGVLLLSAKVLVLISYARGIVADFSTEQLPRLPVFLYYDLLLWPCAYSFQSRVDLVVKEFRSRINIEADN